MQHSVNKISLSSNINKAKHMSSYNEESFIMLKEKIETIVIPSLFVALNTTHQKILSDCVVRIIVTILICFNYDDNQFHQFEQNNYQDIKWIAYLLLPHLNEDNNKLITNFNDIYTSKSKNCDINLVEPQYLHSNMQYNLFTRTNGIYVERQFTVEMLYQNYYLLINTIKTTANKMHVNWMDILPYTLNDYKHTLLYKNTRDKISLGLMNDWDPMVELHPSVPIDIILNKTFTKIAGLQMEDIYNCMSIYLYEEIVSVKWLIFDIVCENEIYPQIFILNEIFNLEKNINDVRWDFLTYEEKIYFETQLKILIEEASNGNDIKLNLTTLSNDSLRSLLKSMIIFFNFGSSHLKEAIKEGYIEFKKEFDEDGDEEKITYDSVLSSLKSLEPKYMYEYISDAIGVFRNTWYGTKMLNQSKTALGKFSHPTRIVYNFNEKTIPITFKNIYNFSKSYVNKVYFDKKDRSKLSRYSLYWSSLQSTEKTELVDRINGKYDDNYYEWFNIKNYVRKLRLAEYVGIGSNSNENIKLIHDKLYEGLKKSWTLLIFETLIVKGVLTYFSPAPQKTDQNFISRDDIYKTQNDMFSTNDTNKYWLHAYHYLTMKPYCEVGEFVAGDLVKYNYFSLSANKKYQWYTAYSYDWIAQIGFCHHFLNNRIQFITGATGVGKSTEIPKLFLYYSKALNYLIAPKIVCTQPRKAPTENNASFVSTTLGVPIFKYDSKGESSDTNNYFVQMKHRDREHTSRKRAKHPVLEYATDGSLILQIDDVLGKVVSRDKYTKENIYDIIMIDEAHEHKINMDLLLTYLKVNLNYNNSIKLVILSATMDEDEPKYRRFYRDINDNRSYPLNTWIANNKIDRICVDRRFHISPPGMGTKYVVRDFYEPTETVVGMVNRIIKSSSEGDILIFQPGTNDITKLVTELNQLIPPDTIAIPYHSLLTSDKREFVERISEKRIFLKISKQEDFATSTNLSKGINSYNRIIIIATNVAEASITIPSLKFVIETGTQKVQLYDYVKRGEKLVKTFISESSRIQRRGRVGRKSSGSVYYLYEKGKMEMNRIICEISTNNISLQLFNKLRTCLTETSFIEPNCDPNLNILTLEQLQKYASNNLSNILKRQYFLGGEYFDYFGNNNFYDYSNSESIAQYYQTGFDYDTLYDSLGKFYIVHPDETSLIRNINGDIVRTKDDQITLNDKSIKSKKLDSFWKMLEDYLYVQTNQSLQLTKTQFGCNMIQLFEKLKLENHSMFRSLIIGLAIGSGEQILRLYILYNMLQHNPQNLFKLDANAKPLINNTIYSNKTSDSLALLEIIDSFHQYLESIEIDSKVDVKKYISYLRENHEYNYTHDDYVELLGPQDKYSQQLRKKIIGSETKSVYKALQNAMKYILDRELNLKKKLIIEWCEHRQLDYTKCIKYIQTYAQLRIDIKRNMSDDDRKFISEIKSNLKTSKITQDKILLALLFGHPFNVCKKIKESNYYISAYLPSLNNMYQIGSASAYKFKPIMLMSVEYTYEYLLYLMINIENNTIIALNKITPELIMMLDNIYTYLHFSLIAQSYDYEKDRKLLKNESTGTNIQNAIIYATQTLNTLKHDFNVDNRYKFSIMDIIK